MDNGAASRAARSMRETPEPMRAAMPTSHTTTTTTTTVLDPTLKLLGKVDRVRRSRGGQDETSRRMHVIDSESRRPRRHYHPFFFIFAYKAHEKLHARYGSMGMADEGLDEEVKLERWMSGVTNLGFVVVFSFFI